MPPTLRAPFEGFGDMSLERVMETTGLARPDAEKAKARSASEPFLWHGKAATLSTLENHFAEQGLRLLQGGRFYHLLGQCDKSTAMDWLCARYKKIWNVSSITRVALGDGPNDIAMLNHAEHGIWIPNSHGSKITSAPGHLERAAHPGPEGWNLAIQSILDKYRQR